jgi:head-tail adaptor
MRLGTQTITVLDATTVTDEYGNELLTWDNPTRTDVPWCSVQPGGGQVNEQDREATTTVKTVWAPSTAVVTDVNHVEYAGVAYAVDGTVDRWDVGSRLDHLVIRLKAVKG